MLAWLKRRGVGCLLRLANVAYIGWDVHKLPLNLGYSNTTHMKTLALGKFPLL